MRISYADKPRVQKLRKQINHMRKVRIRTASIDCANRNQLRMKLGLPFYLVNKHWPRSKRKEKELKKGHNLALLKKGIKSGKIKTFRQAQELLGISAGALSNSWPSDLPLPYKAAKLKETERIIKLHKKGLSGPEIADEIGVHPLTVHKHLRGYADAHVEQVRKLHQNGMPFNEISKRTGLHWHAVKRLLSQRE